MLGIVQKGAVFYARAGASPDVEARLELAEEFHEAAERQIPPLLQGLEERGVAFDENGSIGFISHAIALVKRLETGEKVKPLDDDVLSQLEEEAIDISRQVLRPIEEAYGVTLDDSELALVTIHVQTAMAKAEKARRKQQG